MLQTFQKYLKETNSKIFMNYDGERSKEKHKVVLYDLKNTKLTTSRETDDLSIDFLELLKKKDFLVEQEEYALILKNFFNLRGSLFNKYSHKVIFAFTLEYKEQIEYGVFFH